MHVSLNGWEFDIGKTAAVSQGAAVAVSLPNILKINRFVFAPGNVQVNLFGSFKNLRAVNFGNSPLINVSYISGGPGPGGPGPGGSGFQYVNLLTSLVNIPMEVGTTRIFTSTQVQARRPLYFLDNVGVGKYDGFTKFPLTYPNQYQTNIAYIQEPYVINGYTQLTYLQASSDISVFIYFYPNRNIDMARAFSNEKVIQQFEAPQTSFEETAYIN